MHGSNEIILLAACQRCRGGKKTNRVVMKERIFDDPYRRLFPEYTDHSELHSMTVIDFCNRLIGSEQIEK